MPEEMPGSKRGQKLIYSKIFKRLHVWNVNFLEIFPLLILLIIIGFVPLVSATYNAFFHDFFGKKSFAGLDNFVYLLSDRSIFLSLKITLLWALSNSIINIFISLFIALFFYRNKLVFSIGYPFLLIPMILPVFIAVPVWRMFLYGAGGQSVFFFLTGIKINLLIDPFSGFFSALTVSVWIMIPITSLIFFGALKKIPVSQKESAELEGAGYSTIVFNILFPQVADTVVILGVLNFIKAFKEFTVIFLMTGGGPPLLSGFTGRHIVGATTTMEILLYDIFKSSDDTGISMVFSLFMILIVGTSMIIWLLARHWFLVRNGSSCKRKGKRARKLVDIGMNGLTSGILRVFEYAAFLFVFLGSLMVLYSIIKMSLSKLPSAYIGSFLPPFFTLSNFKNVIVEESIFKYMSNTLIVSVFTSCFVLILSFPAANYLTGKSLSFSGGFLTFLQVSVAIGGIHSLIPLYMIFRGLNLLDTYIPLILIYSFHSIPFSVFIIYTYVNKLPPGLKEIALLEGITHYKYLLMVLVPLSLPVVMVTLIVAFLNAWNGFLAPLIFLTNDANYTVSLKLFSFVGSAASGNPKWNLFAASSIMNLVVVSLLFFPLRKHFIFSPLSHYED